MQGPAPNSCQIGEPWLARAWQHRSGGAKTGGGWAATNGRQAGTAAQDIDRIAARIKARGGTMKQEPKDQPWGMRDLAIEDPDGYKITIAAKLKRMR